MNSQDHDNAHPKAVGNAPVPLSIQDAMNVGFGTGARDAMQTSVRLAQLGDDRGYARYLVTEHHSSGTIAASNPAVVLAYLAAQTSRIRLGSAGVMLPNHSALLVAEQFGALETMAPGRIDLGIGRAPGTDGATAMALRRSDHLNTEDGFPQQVLELIAFLDDEFPDGHAYTRIHAIPGVAQSKMDGGVPTGRPPIIILGSSPYGASLAAALGLPFALGDYFAPHMTNQTIDVYRSNFRPSKWLSEPRVLLAVFALAADTEEEAQRQIRPFGLSFARTMTGKNGLFPSPEQAEVHRYTTAEKQIADEWMGKAITGTGDQVAEGLTKIAASTGADELIIYTYAHDGMTRHRSYEIIADAFAMPSLRLGTEAHP